jgi:hypothetical protein
MNIVNVTYAHTEETFSTGWGAARPHSRGVAATALAEVFSGCSIDGMAVAPAFTEADIRHLAGPASFERGLGTWTPFPVWAYNGASACMYG